MIVVVLLLLAAFTVYTAYRGGLTKIAENRNYKSGSAWSFWRWTKVESEYILRLHVIKTPWCAICLHWIRKPDAEPWLHDHPVSFLSLVLRGKYAEIRQNMGELSPRIKVHTWFNFIRADKYERHRIIFTRANTLTLCFMGPKTREWGFHTSRGWIGWKDYYAKKRDGELDAFDKSQWPAFFAQLNDEADALTRRFIAANSGKIFLDEDKRIIDGGAPDFTAEEATEPHALPGEPLDGPFKAEDGCWYWRSFDSVVHGPHHTLRDAENDRKAWHGDFKVERADFYKKVRF